MARAFLSNNYDKMNHTQHTNFYALYTCYVRAYVISTDAKLIYIYRGTKIHKKREREKKRLTKQTRDMRAIRMHLSMTQRYLCICWEKKEEKESQFVTNIAYHSETTINKWFFSVDFAISTTNFIFFLLASPPIPSRMWFSLGNVAFQMADWNARNWCENNLLWLTMIH